MPDYNYWLNGISNDGGYVMIKFLKWLLCLEPRPHELPCANNRLIMNRNGNISLNLNNPEVRKGIHQEMMKFKDI